MFIGHLLARCISWHVAADAAASAADAVTATAALQDAAAWTCVFLSGSNLHAHFRRAAHSRRGSAQVQASAVCRHHQPQPQC